MCLLILRRKHSKTDFLWTEIYDKIMSGKLDGRNQNSLIFTVSLCALNQKFYYYTINIAYK